MLDVDKIKDPIRMACDWLVDIAQTKTNDLPRDTVNRKNFAYSSWKGAMRGEYIVADKTWWYYCPIWHTGQDVKALVMAADILDDDKYISAAKRGVLRLASLAQDIQFSADEASCIMGWIWKT